MTQHDFRPSWEPLSAVIERRNRALAALARIRGER